MNAVVPTILIGAVSAFLVYHKDYDDGLLGRSALGIIILMSVIIGIAEIGEYYSYNLPLEFSLLLWGIALFGMRHAYRFVMFRRSKKFSWDGKERRNRNVNKENSLEGA